MDVQVLPDGADYESSVPYHRLVTELFLGAARLADFKGAPLPPSVRDRLRSMVDFLAAVQRPDGLMPQVGDADDGRLHILSGYGSVAAAGCAPPVRSGGGVLRQPRVGGARRRVGGRGKPPGGASTRRRLAVGTGRCRRPSRHFPQAGLTVMRRRRDYLLVTNGIVGTAGFGNHKHNDLLGFEYHVDGVPVLVDPGSYVYTSDPDARNLFRSTLSHNTREHRRRGTERAPPGVAVPHVREGQPRASRGRRADGDCCRYRGRHRGYTRLPQPVVHERTFTLSRVGRRGDDRRRADGVRPSSPAVALSFCAGGRGDDRRARSASTIRSVAPS